MGVSLRRSDVETFLACRQKWQYTRPEGHDLEPRSINKALFLGSAVHFGLSEFYRPTPDGHFRDPIEAMNEWGILEMIRAHKAGYDFDANELNSALLLGKVMLTGYLEHYGQTPADDLDQLRFLGTEIPFDVPIPGTDGSLSGTADGLCVDAFGRYWIFESKTYSAAPPRNHHMNFQTLAYAWAFNTMARNGHPIFGSDATAIVAGSIYNGLRKQEPGPRVTKALFVRERVVRSQKELATFSLHLANIYHEMTNPYVAIYPTVSRACEDCWFVDPCYARLTDADEGFILHHLFSKHVRTPVPIEVE